MSWMFKNPVLRLAAAACLAGLGETVRAQADCVGFLSDDMITLHLQGYETSNCHGEVYTAFEGSAGLFGDVITWSLIDGGCNGEGYKWEHSITTSSDFEHPCLPWTEIWVNHHYEDPVESVRHTLENLKQGPWAGVKFDCDVTMIGNNQSICIKLYNLCGLTDPIETVCPCDANWENHGQYMVCVAMAANLLLESGQLTEDMHGKVLSSRAMNDCGKQSP